MNDWYAGTPVEIKGVTVNMSVLLGHIFAGVFQYVLPVIFLAVAGAVLINTTEAAAKGFVVPLCRHLFAFDVKMEHTS